MFSNKYGAVQFPRFCIVGVGNTAVDLASFLLLTLGGVPYLPAQALSYAAGMANSFFVNRRWTFRAAGQADASEDILFVAAYYLLLLFGYLVKVLSNVAIKTQEEKHMPCDAEPPAIRSRGLGFTELSRFVHNKVISRS
ncbi:MAG: GtrA family protein [Bacillota bacterium]|nr:GtrA family protein [Bacillota bacterium]